ncbi:hypothetical protein GF376_01525 [Candidatus Peregrinibacteria bacterium]|nr:hypothetical protein [Candidatus Peregrinibacteria bacterium]
MSVLKIEFREPQITAENADFKTQLDLSEEIEEATGFDRAVFAIKKSVKNLTVGCLGCGKDGEIYRGIIIYPISEDELYEMDYQLPELRSILESVRAELYACENCINEGKKETYHEFVVAKMFENLDLENAEIKKI